MNWGKTAVWTDAVFFIFSLLLHRWNCVVCLATRESTWHEINKLCHCILVGGCLGLYVLMCFNISQQASFIPSDSGSGHFLCGAPQFRISFKSPFYCMGTAIVLMIMAWCGAGMECVNSCVFRLGGVGKLLCRHEPVGRGAELGWMTSSLWLWLASPPLNRHRGI